MTGSAAAEVARIRRAVAAYQPHAVADDRVWAATALILAPLEADAGVAFIRRPTRAGDRWSGQMALPGGKRDPEDASAAATARREAREEVGVDLPEPVGRLDDIRGRVVGGTVATFVFALDERPTLLPAPGEVDAALWIPMGTLLSAEAAVRYAWGGLDRFPGIRFEQDVIWGLTHRIIGSLAAALGVVLPAPR